MNGIVLILFFIHISLICKFKFLLSLVVTSLSKI